MICSRCGKEIPDGVKFCPECGQVVEGQVVSPQNVVPQQNMVPPQNVLQQQLHSSGKVPLIFSTCRMVTGIVSIVLFFFIMFQSCAAGIVNVFSDSDTASGTAGAMLAFCWLIAGIVGLAGKKHAGAVGTAAGFYILGGLIGMCNVGIYADLAIWSCLSIAFALINILSICLRKQALFHKTLPSVLLEIGIIVVMIIFAFTVFSGSDDQGDESEKEVTESEQTSEEKKGSENDEDTDTKQEESDSEDKEKEASDSQDIAYTVTVAEFTKEISDNQIKAKEKYADKCISIEGKISYIGGSEDNYYFSLSDPTDDWSFSTVDCYIDHDTISELSNGMYVTAVGTVKDGLLGLELKDCTVVISEETITEEISSELNEDDSDTLVSDADSYVGSWGDLYSQRCSMDIVSSGDGYQVDIYWSNRAEESTHWSFFATYEEGVLQYANGDCFTEVYTEGEEGWQEYDDGYGSLYIGSDGFLYWNDERDNAGAECYFEKIDG